MRHGYHIAVSKKADFAKLDKTRKFQSISEAKSVKVYNYHVSLSTHFLLLGELINSHGPNLVNRVRLSWSGEYKLRNVPSLS